uniref:Tumor protein p73 isoform X6 n=1 Tax=Tursiops truncatus TaxID=9739 RepID=A0A6J3QEG9_TURTR|nr:tumor protein p73 isoform X6 [Tursiops truncatus]
MSQSTATDEGATFQHLWSSLEPDSTYFDLPQPGQGNDEVVGGAEASMDVFHLQGMTTSVMSQFHLLSSTMDQMSSRAAPGSPYAPEHAASANVPTHSPYAQPSSTFDTMSPAPVIPSNTDYPGPHHFEVTFQQSSTAKSATWTTCPCRAPSCRGAGARKLTATTPRPPPSAHHPLHQPCQARGSQPGWAGPIVDWGGGVDRRRGTGWRQDGHTPASGQTISCKHEGTHASPNRQVLTALCQPPKINKILSAQNLLKHIHLAVLGKERQEGGKERQEGGRARRSIARDLFYKTDEDPGALLLPAPCPGRPEAPELWEEKKDLGEGVGGSFIPSRSHRAPNPRFGYPGLPPPPPRLPSCPAAQWPQVSPPDATRVGRPQAPLPDAARLGPGWASVGPAPAGGLGPDRVCAQGQREQPAEGSTGLGTLLGERATQGRRGPCRGAEGGGSSVHAHRQPAGVRHPRQLCAPSRAGFRLLAFGFRRGGQAAAALGTRDSSQQLLPGAGRAQLRRRWPVGLGQAGQRERLRWWGRGL